MIFGLVFLFPYTFFEASALVRILIYLYYTVFEHDEYTDFICPLEMQKGFNRFRDSYLFEEIRDFLWPKITFS